MATERKFVRENMRRMLLKEYMIKETERAGFGGIHIQRTPMGTRISLIVERPGLVIGRKGAAINRLTEYVERIYGFDNPQIEVVEEENPVLNAQIMAQKVALSLERGWHFRRVGHSTVRRIMDAGARGCQVIISGKLTGERHRTEKFRQGHIKYCGHPAVVWMDRGSAVAKKKAGVIGVKVEIMKPDARLPDEVILRDLSEVLDEEAKEIATEPNEDDHSANDNQKPSEGDVREGGGPDGEERMNEKPMDGGE